MPNHKPDITRALACATLLAALLAGCSKAPQPEEMPAPPPSPAEAPAATPAPDPNPTTNPTETPAAPAQPAPDAPAPTNSSPAPAPAASIEPSVESMSAARPNAKISVPVDLKYKLDGPLLPNQPVMLHVAAVPRVAGSNLKVTATPIDGVRVDTSALTVQKAVAAGVYRQQWSITASDAAPAELRIMVTMDMPEGKAFGIFAVPLDGGKPAQKTDSVKQR